MGGEAVTDKTEALTRAREAIAQRGTDAPTIGIMLRA